MRRSRPGRVHTSPQAILVMKSWNGCVNGVAFAAARSTCSSPSTSRRTRSPSDGIERRLLLALQVDVVVAAGVEARDDAVEQPAREHGEDDLARRRDADLPAAVGVGV